MQEKTEAPNSPKTKMIMEVNGVLLMVFPLPNAQTLGAWLTAFFRLPSGNRSKFAWTAQAYGFEWLGGSGQSKCHWLAATGISGVSTHGSTIKTQDKKQLSSQIRTPQMLLAAHHWFSEGFNTYPNKLHNASKLCSRETTTSTKRMVSRHVIIFGWERQLTKINWMDWSMMDELKFKLLAKFLSFVISLGII